MSVARHTNVDITNSSNTASISASPKSSSPLSIGLGAAVSSIGVCSGEGITEDELLENTSSGSHICCGRFAAVPDDERLRILSKMAIRDLFLPIFGCGSLETEV